MTLSIVVLKRNKQQSLPEVDTFPGGNRVENKLINFPLLDASIYQTTKHVTRNVSEAASTTIKDFHGFTFQRGNACLAGVRCGKLCCGFINFSHLLAFSAFIEAWENGKLVMKSVKWKDTSLLIFCVFNLAIANNFKVFLQNNFFHLVKTFWVKNHCTTHQIPTPTWNSFQSMSFGFYLKAIHNNYIAHEHRTVRLWKCIQQCCQPAKNAAIYFPPHPLHPRVSLFTTHTFPAK